MLKGWAGDVEVTAADIIDGLVINQERAVRVLDRRVGAQDCVVGLDNSSGDARSWVDCEFELGFLAVVCGETLKEERTETRSSSATERVEDQEALEGRAVVLK